MSIPANGWVRAGQAVPIYKKHGYEIQEERLNGWVVTLPGGTKTPGLHKSLTKAKAWAEQHMIDNPQPEKDE